ncbi:Gfo/Idh/MocA family oxidoreductase, partial [Flavobacteriaceae bacterium]|nr:Gfo/Idh/MocA family oxidoreductase [Flavobacteriaceae bacterium]
MKHKIRLGILGGGGDSLIGVVHRIAAHMFDYYQIVGGCFNPNPDDNKKFAAHIGIPPARVYSSFDVLIEEELKLPKEERMQVVSILTPNFLHFPMAKKLLENGFNIICEKPLTTSHAEALELQAIQDQKQVVFAVTYTYTGYPMVRQMKQMIADGA